MTRARWTSRLGGGSREHKRPREDSPTLHNGSPREDQISNASRIESAIAETHTPISAVNVHSNAAQLGNGLA